MMHMENSVDGLWSHYCLSAWPHVTC